MQYASNPDQRFKRKGDASAAARRIYGHHTAVKYEYRFNDHGEMEKFYVIQCWPYNTQPVPGQPTYLKRDGAIR